MGYCAHHAPEGMVDVKSIKCRTEGCGKIPSFGVAGTNMAEYCAHHAPGGMINVRSKKCRTEGCGKKASFGVRYKTGGELCTARTGGNDRRLQEKVQNRRLR